MARAVQTTSRNVEVLLVHDVDNLGQRGEIVRVKPGFARNFLLPQGKAALATPENMKQVEARRAELEKAAAEELNKAKDRAKAIDGVELVIVANAGTEDKLFGSVGPVDIAEAFAAVQIEVERSEVRMPNGPIHELGEFEIGVHLHSDVNATVTVRVVSGE